MSDVFDEGLALFAGLNVIPKRSFLTEYSCRIDPELLPEADAALVRRDGASWGCERGNSFDLDFHTIPFHGEDALVEKHYVSKRSRRQKGILAFLAQDADTRVFCYANAELRKDEQNDEILRFVEFWKTTHGPAARRTDLRLQADHLCQPEPAQPAWASASSPCGGDSRRCSRRSHQRAAVSAWRRIELEGVSRVYRRRGSSTRRSRLTDYEGPIRQLTITDLGHEEPTLLLTNQLRRSPAKLIGRYAQRMIIENSIADGIDFFHMDALSSAVAMKVNCDLQLTLMASSLYRLLAPQIGNGYETAKSRHLFRDFVDATAHVTIDRTGHRGAFPEARPQPSAAGRRLFQTDALRAVAGRPTPASPLRVACRGVQRTPNLVGSRPVPEPTRTHPGGVPDGLPR